MKHTKGFTLIELMIVVAIIAIIASIAIPNLLSARLNANESSAISTLRNVVSAQAQIQAQAAIDEDNDGIGEHGTFGEMAASVPLRTTGVIMAPAVLSGSLGNVDASGFVNKAGYYFALYLPAALGAPVPELANGGMALGSVNVDLCENTWCCYAWPVTRNNTGNRAFMVNQTGDLLQTNCAGLAYTGAAPVPAGDAAFQGAGSISGPLAIGAVGIDGNTWTSVN